MSNQPSAFRFQLANQRGNVAVITALCLSVLIGMFAFVLNTGYLYGEKNRFQNAVEAAAMAGALSLCSDDPVAVARKIAQENGLPLDAVEVQVGFYDERNMYGDFGVYKAFVAEGAGDYPGNQYNNAVMVNITNDIQTLMGGFIGKDEVAVGAAAVAYLVRYGFLALGNEGISVTNTWLKGHPEFRNESIHSNGDIEFIGSETFVGYSWVSAADNIINYSGGREGVKEIDIPPLDWIDLHEQAESGGQVYYPEDWEIGDHANPNEWVTDDFGNSYIKVNDANIRFRFSEGDHNGRVYYFAFHDADPHQPSDITLYIPPVPADLADLKAYNFTLASELNINFSPGAGAYFHKLELGGTGANMSYIFSAGDIALQDRVPACDAYQMNGVVFRCDGMFSFKTEAMGFLGPELQMMRIIANKIEIKGAMVVTWPGKTIFDGLFGPPCPPNIVKLGRIELPE